MNMVYPDLNANTNTNTEDDHLIKVPANQPIYQTNYPAPTPVKRPPFFERQKTRATLAYTKIKGANDYEISFCCFITALVMLAIFFGVFFGVSYPQIVGERPY